MKRRSNEGAGAQDGLTPDFLALSKAIARVLLPAITNGQSLPGMPKKWDGTRFDVVLRFDRTFPEAPLSFRQLCPCLISGDSATPMG